VVGRAVADGKLAWTADILHDFEIRLPWQHRERMLHLGLRAILAVPVGLRNGTRAGLVIYHREPRAFDERDAEGLAALAPFVAVALENAQLQRAARENASRLEGLIRTTARIAGSLETGELLPSIAEEAARLLGVEGAGLRLLEGDQLAVGARFGLAESAMQSRSFRVGEGLTGWVAQHDRPLVVANLEHDQQVRPDHRANALRHGAISYVGVPMKCRDRLVGVLNVYGAEERDFGEADVSLLRAFADQVAVAIENARLFEASRRREAELAALLRATRTVMAGLDL
jgi:GAF domain-containing protein